MRKKKDFRVFLLEERADVGQFLDSAGVTRIKLEMLLI